MQTETRVMPNKAGKWWTCKWCNDNYELVKTVSLGIGSIAAKTDKMSYYIVVDDSRWTWGEPIAIGDDGRLVRDVVLLPEDDATIGRVARAILKDGCKHIEAAIPAVAECNAILRELAAAPASADGERKKLPGEIANEESFQRLWMNYTSCKEDRSWLREQLATLTAELARLKDALQEASDALDEFGLMPAGLPLADRIRLRLKERDGLQSKLAQASNYTANDSVYPTEVNIAGRRITVVYDCYGKPPCHLSVSHPDPTWLTPPPAPPVDHVADAGKMVGEGIDLEPFNQRVLEIYKKHEVTHNRPDSEVLALIRDISVVQADIARAVRDEKSIGDSRT